MRTPSVHRRLPALALAAALLPGCESSAEPEVAEPFVGNWSAAGFRIDGVEQVSPTEDFNLSIGLFRDASYQLIVGGDDSGLLCGGPPSCTEQGDYAWTGSRITLDPGTADAWSFQYGVDGDVMTVSGTLDGSSFSGTLDRL